MKRKITYLPAAGAIALAASFPVAALRDMDTVTGTMTGTITVPVRIGHDGWGGRYPSNGGWPRLAFP